MRYTSVTNRLATLGGNKWYIHTMAQQRAREGMDIIDMTIGEPDMPTPDFLIETACDALHRGRTLYSDGRGEQNLLDALAQRYSQRIGRTVTNQQVLTFPGTQTALYAVMQGVAEPGDEVLVGDPVYASYDGVIAAAGATAVLVPLCVENSFRMAAKDLEARITKRSRVILLNTPHNPTCAVLTAGDIEAIGELAIKHDLWIISDEVYEEMLFSGATFTSPLTNAALAERVIVVSSISKSHAAPGFRSGWCVASEEFCNRLLPLAENMLFGNQPFIADMTALAVSEYSEVAKVLAKRFENRAKLLAERLHAETLLTVHTPQAGMFALIDISAYALSCDDYALDLLDKTGVALMPGSSFGPSLQSCVRLALTISDEQFSGACSRIIRHARAIEPTVMRVFY